MSESEDPEEQDWLAAGSGEEDARVETLAGVQPVKPKKRADYQRAMMPCEACQ